MNVEELKITLKMLNIKYFIIYGNNEIYILIDSNEFISDPELEYLLKKILDENKFLWNKDKFKDFHSIYITVKNNI